MWLEDWLPLERVQVALSPSAALRRGAALITAGKPERAFRLYARASRSGLAEAEYRIGRCYIEGAGVPPSRIEGIRWLEQAANRGHIEAQSLLAAICLHGGVCQSAPPAHGTASLFGVTETTDPDYGAAMRWARMAAGNGSGEAQAVLAFILTSGPQDMRNLDEADFWYERSAAAGCPQGHLGHALALTRKGGGEEVQREVIANLRKSAEAELPTALYLLGVVSEHGLGAARDQAAAAEFYRRAAQKGHRTSQLRWGLALMHGDGVDTNCSEGETWLRRAASAGDPEAAALIGGLYAAGGNLPPNHVEAASWFHRAAEAGHKGAARSLGLLYITGAGVPRDPEEAARWLRVSATGGDTPAGAELGNLLLDGIGDEDDRVRVCREFQQAAASGDLVASFNYGVCLAQGVGAPRDDRQAAVWLRKAADRVAKAQFWYGRFLLEGRGVERDLAQGRSWIARAAESGLVDAQVTLGEMMLNGVGGRCDPPEALALLERAATNGHVGAMFASSLVHAGGRGVPANHIAARHWLRAAAEHGHEAARTMLARDVATGGPHPDTPHPGRNEAVAEAETEAAEDLAGGSAVAGDADLTEGQMEYQDSMCACGSGLRSCRCCDLNVSYMAPPEANERVDSFVHRARQALAGGDATAAERLCLNVLDVAPRVPDALWMLYQIRQRADHHTAAMALLRRLVAVNPNNVDATQELAMLLFQRGDLAAAEQHARNAVRLAPVHPRSHNLMGMILTEAGRLQPGEFHYRRVIELSGARDPILLANLAWNLKGQGRIADARQLYEESVEAAPNVFQTWFGWAQLEEADRNFDAARSRLDQAARIRPDDPGLRLARAVLLSREGDPLAALAELKPGPSCSPDSAGGEARLDPNALLEKGRILDRLQRYDEAFACFDEAKRRARETTEKSYFDREAHEIAQRLRQFFVSDRVRLLPFAPTRERCAQPIFILGFPRSGTTLVEQALSNHPRISAADELPFINELSDTIPRLLGSPLSYPEALSELWLADNRRGLETLRDLYLQKVETRGVIEPGSAWFTDKMPLNEMHLGLIALIFPRSPLVHILRHPLDVILSVFSHHLTHGYFCAYALETIARHYVLIMDLVEHYRTEMALRYLPVRYESMVKDMNDSVRRILEFVGEPFDEHCVEFQKNRRLPHTPSYAQVTEKINDRSLFRYRHYIKHLEPVIPIVQPVMNRLGYTLE
jgi:TPR repeat protein/tetratricopeptide (TPR) repeat protein